MDAMNRLIVCLAFLGVASAAAAPENKSRPEFRAYKKPVTTWVPPYAVAKCKAQLDAVPAMGDALTHLALQFWLPTTDGGVELLKGREASDAVVAELRDWGHARGVRVMLCVYNAGGGKWDWPLAKAAFADHTDAFVKN